MKVSIYIRVSTEDQVKEGYSSGRLDTGKISQDSNPSIFSRGATDTLAIGEQEVQREYLEDFAK